MSGIKKIDIWRYVKLIILTNSSWKHGSGKAGNDKRHWMYRYGIRLNSGLQKGRKGKNAGKAP